MSKAPKSVLRGKTIAHVDVAEQDMTDLSLAKQFMPLSIQKQLEEEEYKPGHRQRPSKVQESFLQLSRLKRVICIATHLPIKEEW